MLLAAGSALLLSACGAGTRTPGAGSAADRASAADAADTADARLRARGTAASRALLARYDATLTVRPELVGVLKPLRAETVRHVAALGGGRTAPASPSPSSSPSPSAGDGASGRVPSDRRGALQALAAAERKAGQARAAELNDASPALARLLASVAACNAGHAELLGDAV
jgi:hypothetical protein